MATQAQAYKDIATIAKIVVDLSKSDRLSDIFKELSKADALSEQQEKEKKEALSIIEQSYILTKELDDKKLEHLATSARLTKLNEDAIMSLNEAKQTAINAEDRHREADKRESELKNRVTNIEVTAAALKAREDKVLAREIDVAKRELGASEIEQQHQAIKNLIR